MCGVCSFSLPSCWAGSSLLCLITYNNGKTRAEQERHEHEASLSYDDGPRVHYGCRASSCIFIRYTCISSRSHEHQHGSGISSRPKPRMPLKQTPPKGSSLDFWDRTRPCHRDCRRPCLMVKLKRLPYKVNASQSCRYHSVAEAATDFSGVSWSCLWHFVWATPLGINYTLVFEGVFAVCTASPGPDQMNTNL